MKKHEIYSGIVKRIEFPNKGIVKVEGEDTEAVVKNVIPGQTVSFRCLKKKGGYFHGNLMSIDEKAPNEIESPCPHFSQCGGCTYQNLSYEDQLKLKDFQIQDIFRGVINRLDSIYFDDSKEDYFGKIYEGIKGSPINKEYRNKMEFSFGDGCKGGELELGLHKTGSFYDILTVKNCQIIDSDYRKILTETLSYFKGKECIYYHKITHEGFLRHLLVRKTKKTGEIMICLVTSSQIPKDTPCCEDGIIEDYKSSLLELKLDGKIKGIIHIINDSLSDVVSGDEIRILYGQDYIEEELLGLKFKITPFSFFQTNSLSAEVIYQTARDYITESNGLKGDGNVLFDLYSGTGTIAQLMAPAVKKVVGVEIVEEAVISARENAKRNGLANCEFIADDVLKALDNIAEKPDFIILDPPRDGVNPKALRKIIDYGVDNILYISCKPTSLARDLEMLMGCGYRPVRMCSVDQFPGTVHVETCVLLSRGTCRRPDAKIKIDIDLDDYYAIKNRETK